MGSQPSNKDSMGVKVEKEKALRNVFLKYLVCSGDFADFKEWQLEWKDTLVCAIDS